MPLVGLEPETFQEERRPAAPRRPRLGRTFWVLLALFLLVMSLGIGELWLFGHGGWNGSRRGVAGINYVRHGFLDTRFAPVENLGPAPKEDWKIYWHHPVLIHVLTGASFRVFGVHEWAARLVPIALSTLSFVLLYVLALRWWGRRGAVATALSFTSLPLLGFYGKMVNHEPLVLALALLLVWLLVRFHEARRWRHVVAAAAVALLGSFSDWPWFLVLFAVGAFEFGRVVLRWRRDRDPRFLVALSLAAVVGLVAVAWYLTQFSGASGLKGFRKLFSDRSGGDGGSHGFASLWARRDWYGELFAPIATVAGLVWLVSFLPRALRRRLGPADALIGGSFVVGLAWLRLFAQAAYIHEYWAFYLVPFLTLATAWLLLTVADAGEAAARRLLPRARSVGAGLLAVGLAATVFVGGRGLLARQVTPSDVGPEAPEFRFRNAIVSEWLGARLDPDDRILLQDGVPIAFQMGFYLRRNFQRVRIHERFRSTGIRRGFDVLLVDRKRLPPDAAVRILRDLAGRYPTTVIDRFCVFDLTAGDNREESIEAWRIEFDRPSLAWRWFESMVYPPYRVRPAPAATFQWAVDLGLDRAARRLAPRVERPAPLPAADPHDELDRLADWVAWHNAQRFLGRPAPEATAALRRAFGPEHDVRFEDDVALTGITFLPVQGDRQVAVPLFLALRDGDPAHPLKVHMDRRPALARRLLRGVPFVKGPERVWHVIDPRPEAWRAGFLYLDAFPYPEQPYPQMVNVFLERHRETTRRDLVARPQRSRTPIVGAFDFTEGRAYDRAAPYAWIAARDPKCAPERSRGVDRLPRGCLRTLRGDLDIGKPTTFTGDDTLRFDGLRYLGGAGGRSWYHVFLTAADDIDADWEVGIAIARPKKGKRPPRYFASPEGRFPSSALGAGETAVLTFAAIGDEGPVSVWLRVRRENRTGGRLTVLRDGEPGRARFPARLHPRYAPAAD